MTLNYTIIVCFFFICLLNSNSYAVKCDSKDQPTQSIIRLDVGNHSASGVIVKKNIILTVLHAIAVNGKIIANINGERDARLIASHEGLDLALLASNTGSLPPIVLTNESPRKVDDVWAIGFGSAKKKEVTIGNFLTLKFKGIVSSTHINPGSSGGGLLLCGKNGFELFGLIKSYETKFHNGKLINAGSSVSVPATEIRKFLQSTVFLENKTLGS